MRTDIVSYSEDMDQSGGVPGGESNGLLAIFGAEVINAVIAQYGLRRVIEFGCGDGSRLPLMHDSQYLGLDMSESAVRRCAEQFRHDGTKSFMLYRPGAFLNRGFLEADLTVCLGAFEQISDETERQAAIRDLFSPKPRIVVLYARLARGGWRSSDGSIGGRDIYHELAEVEAYYVHERIPQRFKDLPAADFIILRRNGE